MEAVGTLFLDRPVNDAPPSQEAKMSEVELGAKIACQNIDERGVASVCVVQTSLRKPDATMLAPRSAPLLEVDEETESVPGKPRCSLLLRKQSGRA